ncbi:MAG: lipopolysaccharide heptosyltransferase I [Sulfuricurvum sp.]|jgi:heptosyltransferase-1|uniref:lipopolysaccharide heptosyltransferase I n=1 Tax=Sulfuricurvum sp. TaxID=2025608 RepID=UPI0025D8FDB6|nr:lipopolysaccharide heptosyltransferase I [Sulfuricurvum sp.]MCI4406617.1 lipopolysaccharide heptosyltransferase I [Sulfuricurvum sp.]
MNSAKLRIAIVRLSALGDIVNTAVALQIVHKYYPNAQIDWYVEEVFAPILLDHPLVHEVISVPIKRIKKTKSFQLLRKSIRNLRSREGYDQIIDAQGLLKSAIVASLIKGKVHGFDRNSIREKLATSFYDTTSAIPYEMNVIKRNVLVIAEGLHIPYNENDILQKEPLFPQKERPSELKEGKNIACVIGASWPSKCYPKEHFATLCDALPYPTYLIWGSEAERLDAQWICEHSSNALLAPKMSLGELVNFISHCDLIIGNDTGPTHIAWAMNRPSITLFGPTNERMIYPTAINIGIKSPSDVNILKIDRHDFSIRHIPPETISRKAKELL